MLIIEVLVLFFAFLLFIILLSGFYVAIFQAAPFVTAPMTAVSKILKIAKIKKGDIVYDLGAGDGRFVHFASKNYGANATGFEIQYFVYWLAKIRQMFWKWKGKMVRANFLKVDLSSADVVICYLLPETLAKYREKFEKELKKGTKVISYAFSITGWEPTEIFDKEGKISKILVYEV